MQIDSLQDIYQFLPISESVVTAGQPQPDQLANVQAAGFTVVINLALPTSSNALPDEPQQVESLGMTYVAIPVEWESPTLADFQQFVSTMQAHAGEPIFVHCAANMRVSAFIYLYRAICDRIPPETAIADLHQIWQPNPIWQAFIDEVLAQYQV